MKWLRRCAVVVLQNRLTTRQNGWTLVVVFGEHMLKGAKNKTHEGGFRACHCMATLQGRNHLRQLAHRWGKQGFLVHDNPKETRKPTLEGVGRGGFCSRRAEAL